MRALSAFAREFVSNAAMRPMIAGVSSAITGNGAVAALCRQFVVRFAASGAMGRGVKQTRSKTKKAEAFEKNREIPNFSSDASAFFRVLLAALRLAQMISGVVQQRHVARDFDLLGDVALLNRR